MYQALRRAYQRPSTFRHLLQALAGVILLGTPHSTSENVNDWENTVLLQQARLISKKKGEIEKEGIDNFTDFSLDFERARLPTPILSVHEILPTKVKTSRLSTKKILVSNHR